MGRKRQNQIKVYLDDDEIELLKKQTEKSRLSQSEYIRRTILNKKIIVVDGIKDFLIELKKIGVNINQIAREKNMGSNKNYSNEFQNLNEGLKNIWEEIVKVLKQTQGRG